MADTETTSTAADPGHDGTDHERIGRVEDKLDALIDTVNKLLPGSHAEAQERTEERLDRASSIEEQVAAELDKRDRLAAEKADADAKAAAEEDVRTRLARLEERPPAPPRLRRTAMLGWGDGR